MGLRELLTRRESPELTWTCHVCGDERPDNKIDVFSVVENLRGIMVQQNVRYCNDRSMCRAGCPGVVDERSRAMRGE